MSVVCVIGGVPRMGPRVYTVRTPSVWTSSNKAFIIIIIILPIVIEDLCLNVTITHTTADSLGGQCPRACFSLLLGRFRMPRCDPIRKQCGGKTWVAHEETVQCKYGCMKKESLRAIMILHRECDFDNSDISDNKAEYEKERDPRLPLKAEASPRNIAELNELPQMVLTKKKLKTMHI